MPEELPKPHRAGFISLVGRPNAGKSTLINALVGEKVAIVADKPQTTRIAVQGIWTGPNAQIVILDTPGIHRSDTLFNRRMMSDVRAALDSRDVILYVADATKEFSSEDSRALDMLRKVETPRFLVLTKVDRTKDKRLLLPVLEAYRNALTFDQYLPVSGKTHAGLPELIEQVVALLPEAPPFFPDDQITDQPQRFLAAEFVREAILSRTQQEVPHSIAVLVDAWEDLPHVTRISMTIYVERDGQKAIIIGKGGSLLKLIGTDARKHIETMIGQKVFLELFIKVRQNWRESPAFLNEIDWRTGSLSLGKTDTFE